MEKMSRDRRKMGRDLGSMRAPQPMGMGEDERMENERLERLRRMASEMDTSGADRAMGEMRDVKEREAMGRAYEQAAPRSMKGYANGGYVKAADGCAQRGKTKGRFV